MNEKLLFHTQNKEPAHVWTESLLCDSNLAGVPSYIMHLCVACSHTRAQRLEKRFLTMHVRAHISNASGDNEGLSRNEISELFLLSVYFSFAHFLKLIKSKLQYLQLSVTLSSSFYFLLFIFKIQLLWWISSLAHDLTLLSSHLTKAVLPLLKNVITGSILLSCAQAAHRGSGLLITRPHPKERQEKREFGQKEPK